MMGCCNGNTSAPPSYKYYNPKFKGYLGNGAARTGLYTVEIDGHTYYLTYGAHGLAHLGPELNVEASTNESSR